MNAYAPQLLKQYPVVDVVETPFDVTFYRPDNLV